jgi:hypothetical protein
MGNHPSSSWWATADFLGREESLSILINDCGRINAVALFFAISWLCFRKGETDCLFAAILGDDCDFPIVPCRRPWDGAVEGLAGEA